MKVLYFDCSSGISGDMTLGALLDLGIDKEKFLGEISKLNVDGFDIVFDRIDKNAINANNVDVVITLEGYDKHGQAVEEHTHEHHDHGHHHDHEHHGHGRHHDHEHHDHEHHHDHDHKDHTHGHLHRDLKDVNDIIDNSTISESAKDLAKRIFLRVAKAEAKVHGKNLDEVHFHEVGAIDSIVDIIGVAICVDMLKPDKICASIVNDGYGFINCQHGKIPVPVPATAQIFAESDVISRQIDVPTELVTPTGAAIIAELSESFGTMPAMKVEKIGYGAGKKELDIPNILRVTMGEINECATCDEVMVIETNIDDLSGEMMGYTMESLFDAGARDVFYSPIYMKKNRPAYKMTVICSVDKVDLMEDIMFKETTTIGVRKRLETRTCLERSIEEIDTKYGTLKVKSVIKNSQKTIYPEYESAKELAQKNGVALKEIYKNI